MRNTSVLAALVLGISGAALAQDPAAQPGQPPPPKKAPTQSNQVYKWVDAQGVVHYTDKPPSESATPAKLPPLQTYRQGTNPDLRKFDKSGTPAKPITGAGGGAAAPQIQVVTPAPDETFHGGERTVPVAVMVTPPLAEGQKLLYMIDGKATGAATTDTAYAFTEVDRGTHTASVAVVDASGAELVRSSGVTFHVLPPIVKK